MKRFSEQFKKQSDIIRMRTSERTQLRERVLSYMEYHPLPSELASAKRTQATLVSEPFVALKLNSWYFRSFAGVFALFMIIGVPFVAERSVPGDMLYPVKVQFNEEVRSSLSLSPYAKVAWETQRVERRIAEARLLANAGKLTEEAEIKVAEAVKNHTDAAQREIAQLRESDSDEAVIAEIAFASALAVQTEVLENHIEQNETQSAEQGTSVVALAEVVAQARESAEASQSAVRPSYEKLLGRVELESTKIYELFASVKDEASEAEMENVERRLSDIERKIEKAVALKEKAANAVAPQESTATTAATSSEEGMDSELAPEDQAEEEAIDILRSALTDIQKLMNYMTHIDVRRSVSVEELVPLTLTPEEQSARASELLETVLALQAQVSARDVQDPLLQKITLGQQELEIKLAAAVGLIGEGSYEAALEVLNEAHVLASDLDTLTQKEPLKVAPIVATSTATSTVQPE
jgi:hypothetical protein